jgi:uncharacterized small protein (DUF1192 family)
MGLQLVANRGTEAQPPRNRLTARFPADPEGSPDAPPPRLTSRLCLFCQAPLTGRQVGACGPRCRAALSRQRVADTLQLAKVDLAGVATLRQRVAELQVETERLQQENQGLRQRNEGLLNLLASCKRERVVEQQRSRLLQRQWQGRRR